MFSFVLYLSGAIVTSSTLGGRWVGSALLLLVRSFL